MIANHHFIIQKTNNSKFTQMQQKNKFLTLLMLLVTTLSFSQTNSSDTTKILFIGNSYTYFNSSPELLKSLAQEKFPNKVVETQLISDGGLTLERHWEGNRAIPAIRSGNWDFVVLQEQSKLGMGVLIDRDMYFGNTDLFFEYARKFDAEIKKAGAKTVFFMTWSVRERPQEQEILTFAYTEMAKELDAILAPIGLVWDKLRTNDNLDLYFRDGSHPSPQGSYLVATTLFATLFEETPLGLSGKISGKKLSSRGEHSLKSQPLIEILTTNAQIIQANSWEVVKTIKKAGYPMLERPPLNYTIPVLLKADKIKLKKIEGRWYGTSSYGSNYLGLILDVHSANGKIGVDLSFYSPDRQDRLVVQEVKLEDGQLHLTVFDSLRTLRSTIMFSLTEGKLAGLSTSYGARIYQYRHWDLSKQPILDKIDIEALAMLMDSFEANTKVDGYVKAAINYYEQYSKLIGSDYLPEERYLNAMGYNYLNDKKLVDALNQFELAMTLFPQSVNTYDSYGEALIMAGQKEKAIEIYSNGYDLAKKTNDRNLAYIEGNFRKLEKELKKDQK